MEIASHKTEGIPNPYGFESLRSCLSQTMRCSDCFYDGMYSSRIAKTFAFDVTVTIRNRCTVVIMSLQFKSNIFTDRYLNSTKLNKRFTVEIWPRSACLMLNFSSTTFHNNMYNNNNTTAFIKCWRSWHVLSPRVKFFIRISRIHHTFSPVQKECWTPTPPADTEVRQASQFQFILDLV